MTTASAHELGQTFDCSVAGCTGTAKANRGIYAYLCDQHVAEKRRQTPAAAAGASSSSGGGLRG